MERKPTLLLQTFTVALKQSCYSCTVMVLVAGRQMFPKDPWSCDSGLDDHLFLLYHFSANTAILF